MVVLAKQIAMSEKCGVTAEREALSGEKLRLVQEEREQTLGKLEAMKSEVTALKEEVRML